MTTHPSAKVLASYRDRTLAPGELLAVDDHLSSCADCRREAHAAPAGAVRRWIEATDGEHLPYEWMERRVNGTGTAAEKARIDEHLAVCAACAGEMADLETFVRPRPPARAWRRLALGLAAAAALLAFLLFVPRREPRPRATAIPAQPQQTRMPAPPVLDEPLPPLDPSLQRVADALTAGRVVSSGLLATLQRAPEQQRGAADEKILRVTDPVGVVVETDRPTFRWTRKSTVTVQVYDRHYELVAASPRVTGSSWQMREPLARGVTYRWQIEVHAEDGSRAVAPAPPAPPALFHVLNARAFDELTKARRSASPLEVGLLCVREGLLEEGARMLARYAAAHPRSPAAARLATQARAAQSAPMAMNGAQ